MTPGLYNSVYKQIRKFISIIILVCFISTSIKSPAYSQTVISLMPQLPAPGVMVRLSPEFTPAIIRGMSIDLKNPFAFSFLIDRGDVPLPQTEKKEQYEQLIKYFLAAMTIAEDKQWVNLSPYEKNKIIDPDFGKTEMGRNLLAQDYILKQITASLMYPEDAIGKKFWAKVYKQAAKEYGTTDIPVNTFNKVWIVPDTASVYEKDNTVLIVGSRLKVMLEEDYLSLAKHSGIDSPVDKTPNANKTHTIASQVLREIMLPELEKEVNEGKNFANLRQIYNGMVLATWYKQALKESILTQIYANKDKVKGVDLKDPAQSQQDIYRRYLKAFKKGVYNYIKEDNDLITGEIIPRKYFSGGFTRQLDPTKPDAVMVTHATEAQAEEAFGQKTNFDITEAVVVATPTTTLAPPSAETVAAAGVEAQPVTGTEGQTAADLLEQRIGELEQENIVPSDSAMIGGLGLAGSVFIEKLVVGQEGFKPYDEMLIEQAKAEAGGKKLKASDIKLRRQAFELALIDLLLPILQKYEKGPFPGSRGQFQYPTETLAQALVKNGFYEHSEMIKPLIQNILGVRAGTEIRDIEDGDYLEDAAKKFLEKTITTILTRFREGQIPWPAMNEGSNRFKHFLLKQTSSWAAKAVVTSTTIIMGAVAVHYAQQALGLTPEGIKGYIENMSLGVGAAGIGLAIGIPDVAGVLFDKFFNDKLEDWVGHRSERSLGDFRESFLTDIIRGMTPSDIQENLKWYEQQFLDLKKHYGAENAEVLALLQRKVKNYLSNLESYTKVGKNGEDVVRMNILFAQVMAANVLWKEQHPNETNPAPLVSLASFAILVMKNLNEYNPEGLTSLEQEWNKEAEQWLKKNPGKTKSEAPVVGVLLAAIDKVRFSGKLMEDMMEAKYKEAHQGKAPADVNRKKLLAEFKADPHNDEEYSRALFSAVNDPSSSYTAQEKDEITTALYFLDQYSDLRQIVDKKVKKGVAPSPGYAQRIDAQASLSRELLGGILDKNDPERINFKVNMLTKASDVLKEASASGSAVDRAQSAPEKKGGIDLNSVNLNLQIKRDGNGVPLPLFNQDPAMLNAPGFVPVILEIKSGIGFPVLSDLQQKFQANPAVAS